MALRYAITNFINSGTPLYASSEDSLYVLENLYNIRPSKPYRSTGLGPYSGGVPDWICVDLGSAKSPNFVGVFNHNIGLGQSGDLFRLLGCSSDCPGQSGACLWDDPYATGGPECVIDLSDRIIEEKCIFNNSCKTFNCGLPLQYWRLEVIDSGNPDGYIEIGEWFLGTLQSFTKARLQPGRADGPVFFEGTSTTYYGQIWSHYFSEAEEFSISIKNINDPTQVSEMRCFLSDVKQAGGKFIFIPDDTYKFCYYVYMSNLSGFGQQIVKAQCGELYEWKIELRTLVKGVTLLD
jgi:hypothetical protein